MDIKRAHRVLEEVARKNGTTVEEVIRNIEEGIDEAIDKAIRENNVAVLEEWAKIPCVGNRPTAAELITCLGERLRDDNNSTSAFLS